MIVMTARRTGIVGALLVVAIGGLVAAVFRVTSVSRVGTPLPDLGQVPEFSLTDQRGQPVSLSTLAGSVWIADFIFTRCAGQCPLMSAEMAKLQQAVEPMPSVCLVSFSVDPTHDTPDILASYAQQYGAQAQRWQFVTGPAPVVAQLCQHGFHLGVGAGESAQEPITHSVRFVLVDQRGHIRGYYDATDPQAVARLLGDIRRLTSHGRS